MQTHIPNISIVFFFPPPHSIFKMTILAFVAVALFAPVCATPVAHIDECYGRIAAAAAAAMEQHHRNERSTSLPPPPPSTVVCELPPGRITSAIVLRDVPPSVALTIRGSRSGTTLDGTYAINSKAWVQTPLPFPWSSAPSTAASATWKAVLPSDAPPMESITQAFVDRTFITEARWPNANLSTMLSLDRWAVTAAVSRQCPHVVSHTSFPSCGVCAFVQSRTIVHLQGVPMLSPTRLSRVA